MNRRPVSDSRLRRLFDAAHVGIVISNNAGAILEANDAFLTIIGYSRPELEDGTVDWRRLTPHEWLELDERAIAELAATGTIAQYEKEYVRKDGTRVPVSLGGARIAGTADEQICYIVDLSAIRRAQAALRRSESRFKRLTDADVIGVIGLRLSDDAITAANDEFVRTIGSTREVFDAGAVRWSTITPPGWQSAVERARRELRECGRFTPYEQELFAAGGGFVPVLIGGALLEDSSDETVCYVLDLSEQKRALLQIQESERRYRILADALPQVIMLADESRVPIYVNRQYEEYTGLCLENVAQRWRETIHPADVGAVERAIGGGLPYEIEYRLRRISDGAYRWHFARSLNVPNEGGAIRWLSTAVDIDDRKRAEESLLFIAKAGARLSQSLDLTTTFNTLLDLVVPEFGDWASITLRDDAGGITTIAALHRDPAKAHLVDAIRGVDCFNHQAGFGTPAVYEAGLPQLLSEVSRADLRAAVKEPYVPIFEQLGYGSLIALPIVAGESVIGTFGIVSEGSRRRYTAADLPALEELARRAGFAIVNARRYEREHRVAQLLQEAALPRRLPVVDGFRFDAYYRAGRAEAVIGGDWFDALVIGDGRIIVSVGDVAGSGLGAAVLMSSVRQVIRGAAWVVADPLAILDVADRTLCSEHEDAIVTAFVGVIDPRRRTMVYASAGHLPALLRTNDSAITELAAPGLPLGCRALGSSESRSVGLPAGSRLLLYTDGLVEWSRDILSGAALLRRRFADSCEPDEAHPAKVLVQRILSDAQARDDVAVLTVSVSSSVATADRP